MLVVARIYVDMAAKANVDRKEGFWIERLLGRDVFTHQDSRETRETSTSKGQRDGSISRHKPALQMDRQPAIDRS